MSHCLQPGTHKEVGNADRKRALGVGMDDARKIFSVSLCSGDRLATHWRQVGDRLATACFGGVRGDRLATHWRQVGDTRVSGFLLATGWRQIGDKLPVEPIKSQQGHDSLCNEGRDELFPSFCSFLRLFRDLRVTKRQILQTTRRGSISRWALGWRG